MTCIATLTDLDDSGGRLAKVTTGIDEGRADRLKRYSNIPSAIAVKVEESELKLICRSQVVVS